MPTPAPAASKTSPTEGAAPAAPTSKQPTSTDPSILDLAALLDPETASPASDDQGEDDEDDTDLDPAEPQGKADDEDDAEDSPATDAEATEDGEEEDPAEETEEEEDKEAKPEGDDSEADPAAADEAEINELLKRGKFTPEQQKVFNKAIGKKQRAIVQLRTDLEQATTARTTLEEQLGELRTMVDKPLEHAGDTPLGEIEDEAALNQKTAGLRALRRWARMNPDGGELPDGKGGKIEKTAEEVRSILADTEEMLEEHVPARQRYIANRRTFDQQAEQSYAWLKDTKSPAAIAHAALMRQYAPLLRSIPEARLVMADALVGASMRVQAAQQAAAKKGDKKSALPPRPGAAGPAKAPPAAVSRPAPKTSATAKKTSAKAEAFVRTGHDEDGAVLSSLLGAGG